MTTWNSYLAIRGITAPSQGNSNNRSVRIGVDDLRMRRTHTIFECAIHPQPMRASRLCSCRNLSQVAEPSNLACGGQELLSIKCHDSSNAPSLHLNKDNDLLFDAPYFSQMQHRVLTQQDKRKVVRGLRISRASARKIWLFRLFFFRRSKMRTTTVRSVPRVFL